MLARARARADAAHATDLELVEADVLVEEPTEAGRYRLAILALNSLMLFPDRALQRRVVARMAGLVAPGGLVVVDAWQPQPIDLARMDGRMSLEWLREDPETGREVTKMASGWFDAATRIVALTTIFDEVMAGIAVGRWTRVDRLRLVAADELADWAEAAGLEVEQLGGDYELAPYGGASERSILVARRPD